jgi:hypothetical protein
LEKFEFIEYLRFCYHPDQKTAFRDGTLGLQWAERYPKLFDEDDVRLYKSQPAYHFYEWLGAILIFESTGYLSLIEKYGAENHPSKTPIWQALAPKALLEMDCAGWPDLFCYSPDRKDFFFCEVKGTGDSLKPVQLETFPKLHKATKKRILVLELLQVNL